MAGRDGVSMVAKPQRPSFFWYTVVPLVLILSMPVTLMCAISFVITHKSSPSLALKSGFGKFVYSSCTDQGFGTWEAWTFAVAFTLYSGLSIPLLAGKAYRGPPTSSGFRPVYRNSGFTYYVLSMLIAGYFLVEKDLPGYPIYKGIPSLVVVLTIEGFLVSALLYVKGLTSPSPGEHGPSGSAVFDFYWGLELYPRVGKRFDVKLWTNSRFGMMLWQLLVLVSWKAQVETSGWNWAMAVTSFLQTAHAAKFFWREDSYMQFEDVVVDRSGYYLSFGFIAFMGPIYAISNFYMVEHCPDMSLVPAIFMTAVGLVVSLLAYLCNRQKQLVRESQGDCSTWRSPARVIRATYRDSAGKEKTDVLLLSGFWSFCHRPDYVLEILTHVSWVLPAGGQSLVPYLSTVFHACLLAHTAYRFEKLCAEKYGRHWREYCSVVKYRMIPYIY
ncbi:uncharacterized protein [Dermacentor albipictus]|uniref:uncharacterized protein n=1 Tax=Dermacentor albipictus TaxID=60249 RepID=UPI0031FCFA85